MLQLDYAQIAVILWRRRVTAVLAFTAVLAGDALVFAFATPRYEASALVWIGDDLSTKDDVPRDRVMEESLSSFAVITETDDVLREAANRVGFDRLFPNRTDLQSTMKTPSIILPSAGNVNTAAKTDMLLSTLRNSLSILPQGKTNLISIAYSSPDPNLAAEFANAVADSAINREIELWQHPGAVDFYEAQRARFETDVKSAASSLANFVSATAIYSVTEQQDLMLRRASELEAALGATKGLLAERAAQKKILVQQLTQIKPVASSSLESNFLRMFGDTASQGETGIDVNPTVGSETLPLPLERVYRDGFASLVNLNSELAGLESLQTLQADELNGINRALSDLAGNVAEFDRLQKAVELAKIHAETFDRRAVDEQINRDLANAKLSGLRVVQSASVPLKATFPNARVLAPAGLICGLFAALAAALCTEIATSAFTKPNRFSKQGISEGDIELRKTGSVTVEGA